jgi:hypothetical protein
MMYRGLHLEEELDPWWLLLPGMNWRTVQSESWPGRSFANTVCAMACTVRMIQEGNAGTKRRRYIDQNTVLRDWLNKAETAEDAYLRRLALCLLVDVASEGEDPQTLLAELVKPLAGN